MLRAAVFCMSSLLCLLIGFVAVFVGVSAVAWIVLTIVADTLWPSPQQQQGQGKAHGHDNQQPSVRGILRAGAR